MLHTVIISSPVQVLRCIQLTVCICQGIGLMMSATLLANGAKVYIIGPKQEDLDRICKVYNDECERTKKSGRMYGIEGDVRKKASGPERFTIDINANLTLRIDGGYSTRRRGGEARGVYNRPFQQRRVRSARLRQWTPY